VKGRAGGRRDMIVIPAVDLLGGKAVRLFRGDPGRKTVFSDDPVGVALRWFEEGAQLLHVVDLDGSFEGVPRNRALVEEIARALPIPVQLGGGIRDLDTAEAYLHAGVERIILGTAVVEDPALVAEACARWPGRVAAAIDARAGRVTVRGWREATSLDAVDLARRLEGTGVAALVYTDVERDGTEGGLNLEAARALASSVSVPVIASGGVASLEDLLAIAELAPYGVEGVIVGRALYTGALDLRQAMAALRGAL